LPIPYPADFTPPPFLDVSGDGIVAPQDAVIVINHINEFGSGLIPPAGEGEAEGESTRSLVAITSAEFVDELISSDQVAASTSPETPSNVRGHRTRAFESSIGSKYSRDDATPEGVLGFLTGFDRGGKASRVHDDSRCESRWSALGDDDLNDILEAIAEDIDEAWA
jgi:hypothetical protein